MTDEDNPFEKTFTDFLADLRKSASIKTGAVMFGEAQVAYYDVLKGRMEEQDAYNMLAHTTEVLLRSIATAAGPVLEAVGQFMITAQVFGVGADKTTDKEVPGAS